MVGPFQCGKTTLINSYFHKQAHCESNPTTAIEISYSTHQTDEGSQLRVKCWDTSGEDRYQGMVCYHIKEAHLVCVLFELDDRTSSFPLMQVSNEWTNGSKPSASNSLSVTKESSGSLATSLTLLWRILLLGRLLILRPAKRLLNWMQNMLRFQPRKTRISISSTMPLSRSSAWELLKKSKKTKSTNWKQTLILSSWINNKRK